MKKATVNPGKLREALSLKVGAARKAVWELQQSERPEFNRYNDPRAIVVEFLHAARGVFPIAQTFAAAQGRDFNAWYAAWRDAIRADLALWDRLRDDRVQQEHGDGADIVAVEVPILFGAGVPEIFRNRALLGGPPDPPPTKGGVRFAVDPGRPASEVATDYLRVAQRFVDDFLRDHAALIP